MGGGRGKKLGEGEVGTYTVPTCTLCPKEM